MQVRGKTDHDKKINNRNRNKKRKTMTRTRRKAVTGDTRPVQEIEENTRDMEA